MAFLRPPPFVDGFAGEAMFAADARKEWILPALISRYTVFLLMRNKSATSSAVMTCPVESETFLPAAAMPLSLRGLEKGKSLAPSSPEGGAGAGGCGVAGKGGRSAGALPAECLHSGRS